MSWLRLDDGFATHPKILALSEAKRWRWVALLLTCARHSGQGGRVTAPMLKAAGLSARELLELELLDVEGDEWRVHDWDDFNRASTSAAQRQARYRERQRTAEVSGKGGERDVTETSRVTVATRARSRPVPSPVTTHSGFEVDAEGFADDLDFGGSSRPALPPELAHAELEPARELEAARLLSSLGELEPATRDAIRAYAARAPEALLARIVERLGDADIRDRAGYVLGALRKELGT